MSNSGKKAIRTYGSVPATQGLGPGSAGQSGDTQGLSGTATSDSESVTELLEEGQFYEAEVVSGVENAADADASEVRTRQVPVDDVPNEYLNNEYVDISRD